MEACSEAEDDLLLKRGWTLYNVLRSIHGFAERERPERVAGIFPDPVLKTIRASTNRLQSRSAPGESAGSALGVQDTHSLAEPRCQSVAIGTPSPARSCRTVAV
jgi:hypothetical protein